MRVNKYTNRPLGFPETLPRGFVYGVYMSNVYLKINNIMSRVNSVYKGANVGYGSSQYKAVTHDDVTRLLHQEFVKEKLVMLPNVVSSKLEEMSIQGKKGSYQVFASTQEVEVSIINAEKPEEFITSKAFGFSFDTQDKAIGKSYSYAVKYALLKMFMLESSDNEEDRIALEKLNKKTICEKKIVNILDLISQTGTEVTEHIERWAEGLTEDEYVKYSNSYIKKLGEKND